MRFFVWRPNAQARAATVVAVCALVCGIVTHANAATLNIRTSAQAYRPGDRIHAVVSLDTEGEEINAMQSTLLVSGDAARIVDVHVGGSVVPLWVQKPAMASLPSIPFAGMIPGGRTEDGLSLFTIVLQATQPGDITLAFQDPVVLRHDGQGTAIPSQGVSLTLQIRDDAPRLPTTTEMHDTRVPDVFVPFVTRDPALAGGKAILVFLAQDKDSGIVRYEIFETPQEITRDADVRWEPAESPYRLKDQARTGFIYVKAIDQAGNQRIVRVDPERARAWFEDPDRRRLALFCLGILVMLGYSGWIILWKKKLFPWEHDRTSSGSSRRS